MRIIIALFAALALSACALAPQDPSIAAMKQVGQQKGNLTAFVGNGAYISPTHILTANHLVQPFSNGGARLTQGPDGRYLVGKAVYQDTSSDVAVLRTDEPHGGVIRELRCDGGPLAGETVTVRSLATEQTVKILPDHVAKTNPMQMKLHWYAPPGTSGSPVLDEQGRVAAVISGNGPVRGVGVNMDVAYATKLWGHCAAIRAAMGKG